MARTKRATWVLRLEQWKQSGLDAVAFAATLGVTARTLKWWQWRIAGERSSSKPKAISGPREAATPTVTFVEMTGAARVDPIEIVLRNDLRVRVGSSFDEQALGRVLDVLERR